MPHHGQEVSNGEGLVGVTVLQFSHQARLHVRVVNNHNGAVQLQRLLYLNRMPFAQLCPISVCRTVDSCFTGSYVRDFVHAARETHASGRAKLPGARVAALATRLWAPSQFLMCEYYIARGFGLSQIVQVAFARNRNFHACIRVTTAGAGRKLQQQFGAPRDNHAGR